jgi:ABC-2 type transport system ATP-binding protein
LAGSSSGDLALEAVITGSYKIELTTPTGLLSTNITAGKSTTILMMLGLTEPDEGSVRVCGLYPTADPVGVKKMVGYLPEEVGFYDDLTGMENLTYTARLNGFAPSVAERKAAALLERIGLAAEKDKRTGKYSRGMRQRLGLADVLIKEPEVIILDEPTLGIDPAGVKQAIQREFNSLHNVQKVHRLHDHRCQLTFRNWY